METNIIYALDFDGVICDSTEETGIAGWLAASSIWADMPKTATLECLEKFKQVRPIIETGYEAILVMRLLHLGESVDAIYANYHAKIESLLEDAKVNVNDLKKLFGATRDAWIASDLAGWIQNNPLFPGVANKLEKLGDQWLVITTKQERFVKCILQAHGIQLPDDRIFGLDRNMSKAEVLRNLLVANPKTKVYFVEDRLPMLLNVLNEGDLAQVKLILALWGYNTAEEKLSAEQKGLTLQTLEDFLA